MKYLLADKGYDADALRKHLREAGIILVFPGRCNRKRLIRHDKIRYKDHHLIENVFGRIKDFRRVAPRYHKLQLNCISAVTFAILLAYWI